jgi:hypothetical protein
MRWLSKSHPVKLAVVLLLTVVACMIFSGNASAFQPLNATAPTPQNSNQDGAHVFYIRKSVSAGVQRNVIVKAYLHPNIDWSNTYLSIAPSGNPETNTASCDSPISTVFNVKLSAVNGGSYNNSANNICGYSSGWNTWQPSFFFRGYPLPAKPSAVGPSGYYEVQMEVRVSQFDNTKNLGVRFTVSAVNYAGGGLLSSSQAKIGQIGGIVNGERTNFPIVGSWSHFNDATSSIEVPFGFCGASARRSVGIYDSDNGSFNGNVINMRVKEQGTGYMTLQVAGDDETGGTSAVYGSNNSFFRPGNSNSNATLASASFQMTKGKKYVLEIYNLDPNNTVDISVPGDTIYGDIDCGGCVIACKPKCQALSPECPAPPERQDRFVSLLPSVAVTDTGPIEPGADVHFDGKVTVSGFPLPEEWGYSEVAKPDDRNTQTPPNRVTYDATPVADNSPPNGSAVGWIKCASGWSQNTCNSYACSNGSNRPNAAHPNGNCGTQGGWIGRCTWNGQERIFDPQGSKDVPNCIVWHHQCRHEDGAVDGSSWRDLYNGGNGDKCTKWHCPSIPSGSGNGAGTVDYGPNFTGSSSVCKIFQCLIPTDYTNPYGGHTWYDPEHDDNLAGRCIARCSTQGNQPPYYRQTSPQREDYNCYVQPSFNMTCYWYDTTPTNSPLTEVVGYQQTVAVTSSNDYCQRSMTRPGGSVGLYVCMSAHAAATSGWNPSGSDNEPGWAPFDYKSGVNGQPPTGVHQYQFYRWLINAGDFGPRCASVSGSPYFKVYGSDIRAGGTISTDCTAAPQVSTNANVLGHNKGAASYAGAGTQYAVLASGAISGVASSQYLSNENPASAVGSGLWFANVGSPGGFADMGCVDFTPDDMTAEVGPKTVTQADVTPGTGAGHQVTRYVKGDVYIGSDIKVLINNVASIEKLPYFRLIVEGNIYIGKGVHRLDGTYVAMPTSDPNSGNIYTCATGNGSLEPNTLSGCEDQLVVNGAFAARSIKLLRDCGSLAYAGADGAESTFFDAQTTEDEAKCSSGSNHAAETFNYSPELWLTKNSNTTSGEFGFDSISRLAPVL